VSGKLPRVTSRQFIRVIEQLGWDLDRSRGSHRVFIHSAGRRTLTVPVARRVMSIGTLSRLLKDADISRDEFRRLLRG